MAMQDKTSEAAGALKTTCAAAVLALFATAAPAADYTIDESHAFIQFRVKHLGYSWLVGRFNRFSGAFSYDADGGGMGEVEVEIDTASVDSNHAERDKHLRNEDFLDVAKYPSATFRATRYDGDADGGTLHGELTLHGHTRPLAIAVRKIGEGPDPWGGYRAGFEGKVVFALADFGIDYDLGPAAKNVEMELHIEGIRR